MPPKSNEEENGNKNSNELQNEPQLLPEEISKTSSGGSVLMEKVNENLEALLKAFDARITSNMILPPTLQEYPNPIQEKHRLVEHMKLIKEIQTKWEAPPKEVDHIPKLSPTLEPIDEEHSLRSKLENLVVLNSEPSLVSNDKVRINPEEVNHQELWDEIRELKQDRASFEKGEAPLTMIGSSLFEINESEELVQEELDEKDPDQISISRTLATLPSYLGRHDPGSEIISLPIKSEPTNPEMLDSIAQKLLKHKFNVPMTLEEIIRFKPNLWAKMMKQLNLHDIFEISQPQELCKVSQYIKAKGDKGNTILKLTKNSEKHLAILDTGAGVSIITKETWKKWDKQALTSTRMGL